MGGVVHPARKGRPALRQRGEDRRMPGHGLRRRQRRFDSTARKVVAEAERAAFEREQQAAFHRLGRGDVRRDAVAIGRRDRLDDLGLQAGRRDADQIEQPARGRRQQRGTGQHRVPDRGGQGAVSLAASSSVTKKGLPWVMRQSPRPLRPARRASSVTAARVRGCSARRRVARGGSQPITARSGWPAGSASSR